MSTLSLPAPDDAHPRWTKSSRSGYNGNCVEVAVARSGAIVRDSKDSEGSTLAFGFTAWRRFVTSVCEYGR